VCGYSTSVTSELQNLLISPTLCVEKAVNVGRYEFSDFEGPLHYPNMFKVGRTILAGSICPSAFWAMWPWISILPHLAAQVQAMPRIPR
jgi:hypothetical protein